MLTRIRPLAAGLASLLAMLAFAGQAGAADVFRYSVVLRPANYLNVPSGSVGVTNLDPAKTTTFKITAGGVAQAAINHPSGVNNRSISSYAFAAGDTIKVEQPTGVLVETYTIPDVSISGSVGSAALTGRAPDGTVTITSFDDSCYGLGSDDFNVAPQGGAFSVVFPQPLIAGSAYSVLNYPGKGDTVRYDNYATGETPCIAAEADLFPTSPGGVPDPLPFRLEVHGLRPVVATGARLVLRRAGAILVDFTNAAATTNAQISTAVQPLPGDVVEVYRPHNAGAPSATFAIPSISAVYDRGNSLVAFNAPAASRAQVSAGTQFAMFGTDRVALNTQPGRTLLDFASAQGEYKPFSLAGADFIIADWFSQDTTRDYSFNPVIGDLTSPSVSVKLDKKFKLAKLGSSLAAKITSSEAATAKATLTLPAKLNGSKKKAKAPRVIATAKLTLGAGVTKIKLKFTKSGKKLIKKMRSGRYPSNKATLTLVASDFSGNGATAVGSTKLVAR